MSKFKEKLKIVLKNRKLNIIFFIIVLIDIIFSIFTKYGIMQKIIPLLIFLISLGLACCIDVNNYKYLTKTKKILHIFL